jgi:hypothetical protein
VSIGYSLVSTLQRQYALRARIDLKPNFREDVVCVRPEPARNILTLVRRCQSKIEKKTFVRHLLCELLFTVFFSLQQMIVVLEESFNLVCIFKEPRPLLLIESHGESA